MDENFDWRRVEFSGKNAIDTGIRFYAGLEDKLGFLKERRKRHC